MIWVKKFVILCIIFAAPMPNIVLSQGIPQNETCKQPMEIGPCPDYRHKWGYNYEKRICVEFPNGQCNQNKNNFKSEFGCYTTCEVELTCRAPPSPGVCRAAITRWAYDPTSKRCSKFTWGGCGGSLNRFMSEAKCYEICEGIGPAPANDDVFNYQK